MFRKKITNIILLLSLAVFLFGSGFKLGEYRQLQTNLNSLNNSVFDTLSKSITEEKGFDFSLFWQAWSEIE